MSFYHRHSSSTMVHSGLISRIRIRGSCSAMQVTKAIYVFNGREKPRSHHLNGHDDRRSFDHITLYSPEYSTAARYRRLEGIMLLLAHEVLRGLSVHTHFCGKATRRGSAARNVRDSTFSFGACGMQGRGCGLNLIPSCLPELACLVVCTC